MHRFTPLHWAASHRYPNLEILSILLAHSPEAVFIRDYEGMRPLDRMMRYDGYSRDAMELFLDTQEKVRKGLLPLPEDKNKDKVKSEHGGIVEEEGEDHDEGEVEDSIFF
jgi:ankyrin repeat protein